MRQRHRSRGRVLPVRPSQPLLSKQKKYLQNQSTLKFNFVLRGEGKVA